MNRRQQFIAFACFLPCLLAAGSVTAQESAEGFALNRFEPSERGSDWFVLESLDLRGHERFALGAVFDYARKPLVLYSGDDEERAAVVGDQVFAHVGGGIILWDRVRFALSLPIALYQDGVPGVAGATRITSENETTVGDLRLGADVRLAGEYGSEYTLGFGVQLHAPTGSQESFTGDGSVRFAPRFTLAGELGDLVYGTMLGMNVRVNDTPFGGTPRGSEVTFGAGLGGKGFDDRVMVGLELFTSTVVTNNDAFFARRTTPLELLLGWHIRAGDSVRINAGAGPGMTRALGTPQFRAVASIEWLEAFEEAAPPPSDRDRDGVLDRDDACPDTPGVPTADPKTNGCPPPADRDKDDVIDELDACPDQPGTATDDPKTNGCPDRDQDGVPDDLDACPNAAGIATNDPKTSGCPDRDQDTILDPVDACPVDPGVANEDPKKHGCPPPKDSDGDQILDPEDACPKDPGQPNADPKKHGCPVARVEKGQIVIREQVQFAYNSAQILKASDFVLEAVLKIFKDNPQIKKVSVEGHTDDKGSDTYNKRLSLTRAQAVMQWLVRNGIAKDRLEAKGFGEEKPIDTNETDEGRTTNRRVEFHIIDPAAPEGGASEIKP